MHISLTHVGPSSPATMLALAQALFSFEAKIVNTCNHLHLGRRWPPLTDFCTSWNNTHWPIFSCCVSSPPSLLPVFLQCARSCPKGWWLSSVPLPAQPPTPSSAISAERKRWVCALRWPVAHVALRARSTTTNPRFGTMMLISCRVGVFCRGLRGNEILVRENDEIPQQCHNSPFQSHSSQSTAGHFISSIPLISLQRPAIFIDANSKTEYEFCCLVRLTLLWHPAYSSCCCASGVTSQLLL